ncbi:hypothetical protein AABC73_20580 [Pseudomonas sp. G.S.17]|uniref:hypothetical protein n=1 Tax=Pseudomonas sp. G.S.17 TaxID=3137451 RepID=UPI00311CD2D9
MTDIKRVRVATIIPAPQRDGNSCHMTQGTRVLLDDGSELDGVVSITLRAEPNGLWAATIEVMPQVVPSITANAEVKVIDITALKDESREYAAVAAD